MQSIIRFFVVSIIISLLPVFSSASTVPKVEGEGDIFVGFASLNLDEKATPIDVCRAIPKGSIWQTHIKKSHSIAWSGYHRFSGTIIAHKPTEDKCIMYRFEDNLSVSGSNPSLSSSTVYIAVYSKDETKPLGYFFTGFEPINGKSQSKMRNDGVAAMELVRVCESYEGKIWQYDDKQHADIVSHVKTGDLSVPCGFFTSDNISSYNDKYREGVYKGKSFPVIDCVTLIKLAIAGIPYEYSPYVDRSYLYRQLNAYPWAIQPNNVWLYELMEWCISSGYEIEPGPNFENLQAGDLVFYASDEMSSSNAQPRKVCHVAMFTGRWVADKGYKPIGVSGKDYPTRYRYPIFNDKGQLVGVDTIKMHPQTIEVTAQASDKLPNTCVVSHSFLDWRNNRTSRREQIVMYARLPLNTKGCWNNRNPWDNPANMIHASDFDTEYRIDIIGDGNPVSLYIGSLNQAGVLEEKENAIMTDYMPYRSDAYENLPHSAKLQKVEYYDALLKPVYSVDKAKYVRKQFVGTTLQALQNEYMYNGVNQYKVMNRAETPIIIYGILKKNEHAIIDTITDKVQTSMGSELKIIKGKETYPGMKVIYCPTGQETMVTWNN